MSLTVASVMPATPSRICSIFAPVFERSTVAPPGKSAAALADDVTERGEERVFPLGVNPLIDAVTPPGGKLTVGTRPDVAGTPGAVGAARVNPACCCALVLIGRPEGPEPCVFTLDVEVA